VCLSPSCREQVASKLMMNSKTMFRTKLFLLKLPLKWYITYTQSTPNLPTFSNVLFLRIFYDNFWFFDHQRVKMVLSGKVFRTKVFSSKIYFTMMSIFFLVLRLQFHVTKGIKNFVILKTKNFPIISSKNLTRMESEYEVQKLIGGPMLRLKNLNDVIPKKLTFVFALI